MLRKPRIEYAGAVYHVLNRGDQGSRIYKDDLDAEDCLSVLGKTAKQRGWMLYAYRVLAESVKHLRIPKYERP